MTTRLEARVEAGHRIRLAGELDISTVPELEQSLDGLADDPYDPLVLELTDLTFIDSTGLRAILRLARSHADRGRLVLRAPTPRVLEVLTICGVLGGPSNLELEREEEGAV
ncbi:MAG TPA: STAS domain-containing protein [Actinomycetota bacterium]